MSVKIHNMKIQVLMSTMNRQNINELKLSERNITHNILVINQTKDNLVSSETNNITMINRNETGTSNSRNCALKNCEGEICIFADDDIVYVKNYEDIVLQSFEDYPEADIITFQIQTPEGTLFKDNYMKSSIWHSLRTAMKVASIEIAFRRESIVRNRLELNKEFGLGSRYRIHDDVIFIADAIKQGLKVRYIPTPIVIHPAESSGTMYNDFLILSKGAAFYQIFGIKCFLINIIFAIKKYKYYNNQYSFFSFVQKLTKGSIEYLKTH